MNKLIILLTTISIVLIVSIMANRAYLDMLEENESVYIPVPKGPIPDTLPVTEVTRYAIEVKSPTEQYWLLFDSEKGPRPIAIAPNKDSMMKFVEGD